MDDIRGGYSTELIGFLQPPPPTPTLVGLRERSERLKGFVSNYNDRPITFFSDNLFSIYNI